MIARDPFDAHASERNAADVTPGLIGKFWRLIRRLTYDVLVAHFPTVVVAVAALAGYSWQAKEGNVPTPGAIADSVRARIGLDEATPHRPQGIAQIALQPDGGPAGRLVASLHLRIVERIRPVGAPLTGMRVVYRLTDLRGTGTARTAADLRWAMRTPGRRGWLTCGPVGLQFANHAALISGVAAHLNNAITTTEKAGEPMCS